ncbi:MAG TPA: vWA domain-containing protein [Polyangia bacterium]|nr:vWA domain-containing protein [Polyangia bacterium]
MTGRSAQLSFRSRLWRVVRWAGLGVAVPALWACTSRTLEPGIINPTANLTAKVTQKINNNIDILFMIDNSSSMTSMQQKLLMQLPAFMQVLQMLPNGLPNVHIAVVSSDMGAPGDSTSSIACTQYGDDGNFQAMPRGSCTSTTLSSGSNFISDVDKMPNFTDPIEKVFQCIALLGASGCGFEHQLASIDRALGADNIDASGTPHPPDSNANFLRPEAYLGIVLLTNEDDCSAPANTQLFSLNGQQQGTMNQLGPIANYRCNQFGHLCKDANGNMGSPPLAPPAGATQETFTNCVSNDSGNPQQQTLTPVTKFVQDIKTLKTDPDNTILVAAITAPPDPYVVEWLPPASPPPGTSGQVWPQVMHSCGAKGGPDVAPNIPANQQVADGSFGDPGVRITQFVKAFPNYFLSSICDASYAASMTAIATKLGALIKPNCIKGTIQKDDNGQPVCSVTNNLTGANNTKTSVKVANCAENGNAPPCWTLNADPMACPGGGVNLKLMQDNAAMNAASLDSSVDCSLCLQGSTAPGCPCPNDPNTLYPNCP